MVSKEDLAGITILAASILLLCSSAVAAADSLCDDCSKPQDVDSEGLYEDTDGDSDVGFIDAYRLYQALESNKSLSTSKYDFNGDGDLSFGVSTNASGTDPYALYQETLYEPPKLGENMSSPNDPDKDTIYEDINGDGEVSFLDSYRLRQLAQNESELESRDSENPEKLKKSINVDGIPGITVSDSTALYYESLGFNPTLCDSCEAGRSIDADIRLEDVNGDGKADRKDLIKHYEIQNEGVRENLSFALDYDRNGKVDFTDSVLLYQELESKGKLYGDAEMTGTSLKVENGEDVVIAPSMNQKKLVVGNEEILIKVSSVEDEENANLNLNGREYGLNEGETFKIGFFRFRIEEIRKEDISFGSIVRLEASFSSENSYVPPKIYNDTKKPRDLDSDGLYEDLDGNGEVDFTDTSLLQIIAEDSGRLAVNDESQEEVEPAVNFDNVPNITTNDASAHYYREVEQKSPVLCDGCDPAKNIDSDIRKEDVNGDGKADRNDLFTLWKLTLQEDKENITYAVDFSRDNSLDILDVRELFLELREKELIYGDADYDEGILRLEYGEKLILSTSSSENQVSVNGTEFNVTVDSVSDTQAKMTVGGEQFTVQENSSFNPGITGEKLNFTLEEANSTKQPYSNLVELRAIKKVKDKKEELKLRYFQQQEGKLAETSYWQGELMIVPENFNASNITRISLYQEGSEIKDIDLEPSSYQIAGYNVSNFPVKLYGDEVETGDIQMEMEVGNERKIRRDWLELEKVQDSEPPEFVDYWISRETPDEATIKVRLKDNLHSRIECHAHTTNGKDLGDCTVERSENKPGATAVKTITFQRTDSTGPNIELDLSDGAGNQEDYDTGPVYRNVSLEAVETHGDPRKKMNLIVYGHRIPENQTEDLLEDRIDFLFNNGDLSKINDYRDYFNWYVADTASGKELCGDISVHEDKDCIRGIERLEDLKKDDTLKGGRTSVIIMSSDGFVAHAYGDRALISSQSEGTGEKKFAHELGHMIWGFDDEYGEIPTPGAMPTHFFPKEMNSENFNITKYPNTWASRSGCEEDVNQYYKNLTPSDCNEQGEGYYIGDESLMKTSFPGTPTELYENHIKRMEYLFENNPIYTGGSS